MATQNHIGRTIYVAAALPATNDAAGFAALTWTKAAGVQQTPQLGVSHGITDVEDMESGFTAGVKAAATGMDSQMAFRDLGTGTIDAGQLIIRTQARQQQGNMSIKIVDGTGLNQAPQAGDPVQYAQGFAHSYQENQGSVSSFRGFTVNFKQNAETVDAVE